MDMWTEVLQQEHAYAIQVYHHALLPLDQEECVVLQIFAAIPMEDSRILVLVKEGFLVYLVSVQQAHYPVVQLLMETKIVIVDHGVVMLVYQME